MFDLFLEHYKPDSQIIEIQSKKSISKVDKKIKVIIDQFNGFSFNRGIFRICNNTNTSLFTELAEEYFPKLKNKIKVFAFDWLGRFFALETKKVNSILLIEPGAGDALEIPSNIDNFFNSILIQNENEALAKSFYSEWLETNNNDLHYSDCIGYKIPLFLGGEDEVTNLETINTEVYFSICSQLWNKTRQLNKGQTINNISIS
jgi:hypothetical protein